MTDRPEQRKVNWRRRCGLVFGAWLLSTVLFSYPSVRGIAAIPLFVNDADCSGEAAYVMADGFAYMERLRAASDLYHMDRVPRILVPNETANAGYNFIKGRSESRVERAIDYLALHGVPRDKISIVDFQEDAMFGSLSESQNVAIQESTLKQLVVVTSAPHTRRTQLCFRRSLSKDTVVRIHAATQPSESAEIESPLWVEYVKLVVYFLAA